MNTSKPMMIEGDTMHRLSIDQVLSLWRYLEDAYHGEGSVGGDVAEIAVYRFMPCNPNAALYLSGKTGGFIESEGRAVVQQANESFFHLLMHFSQERDATVEVQVWDGASWRFTKIGDGSRPAVRCTNITCACVHAPQASAPDE